MNADLLLLSGRAMGCAEPLLVRISLRRSCHQLSKLTNAISFSAWKDCGLDNHASRSCLKADFKAMPKT